MDIEKFPPLRQLKTALHSQGEASVKLYTVLYNVVPDEMWARVYRAFRKLDKETNRLIDACNDFHRALSDLAAEDAVQLAQCSSSAIRARLIQIHPNFAKAAVRLEAERHAEGS